MFETQANHTHRYAHLTPNTAELRMNQQYSHMTGVSKMAAGVFEHFPPNCIINPPPLWSQPLFKFHLMLCFLGIIHTGCTADLQIRYWDWRHTGFPPTHSLLWVVCLLLSHSLYKCLSTNTILWQIEPTLSSSEFSMHMYICMPSILIWFTGGVITVLSYPILIFSVVWDA